MLLQMDKQIDTLRASQAEKQLELREAATKRKLLALKQQLNASVSPTSAPPLSPHPTHHTLDTSTAAPISPNPQSTHHTTSVKVQQPMGSYTAPAVQQNKRPQRTPHEDTPSPSTSNDTHPSSNLCTSPPSTVTSPQSPSQYHVHSPPPATPFKSPPDAPTHAVEGVQSRNSSTRDGMSALKARLMASQDSDRSKHTGTGAGIGGRTGGTEQVKGSTLPRKEVEFMSVAQRQKERVERIRRAMHAAMVIQRTWRRYRSRVEGKR